MSNPDKAREVNKNNQINDIENMPGVCPVCGSMALTYGNEITNGDQISYPFTCDECKHENKEHYSLTFIGFDIK